MMENIGSVMVGKETATRMLLVALLSGGHVLVEDVPGVGKTMLARALAASIGGSFSRIQCTPDLLPSDITGLSVYDQRAGDFVFRPGPLMSQIVLADEINRATPRTQSSLLEAMGEGQVTVDGQTYRLEQPFLVMATQNPVEFEGTFPLPEAQLDRFFLSLSLGYPSVSQEKEVLYRLQERHPIEDVAPVTSPEQVRLLQQAITKVYVEESVAEYLVRLVQATRTHPQVQLGASPRGSLALFRAAQALAALEGRDYVLPDDVKQLAVPVLAHRLTLKADSILRGVQPAAVVRDLLRQVPVGAEELN
ncbi:MAG: MoxR family ATPase [Limnochordia bacterium]|nr:MoxR family ATPase [Limnochordia bacterium]MDI9465349.1 MoxR family ATPase [Bacillota bacterium]NLO96280.1 MoxR family ATPase [Bacillota bacterium]HOB40358.1 MoxR family ATPase [Limnochordia bacterium]HOK32264.1 MoxR family ATPase [Limnochordia bacterium]